MVLQRRKRHNEPLELRFSVASPRQWAKASVAPAKLIRNLDDEFATPQQLLGEALFQMRGMNRVDLACARRLKLCLVVQRRVWPALNAALEALRKHDNGVPEPKSQQELLDLVDQMGLALIAGYQIVIEGDYRPDDRHGRAQQARILEAGVRALEIVHLQQRLRALRYQPLPAASWQLANTLFCVMARAEHLVTPVSAITTDRTLLDTKGNTQALRLYHAIQRFGLFDTFSWCKPQQRFLDTYCANLPDGVSISYAVQPLSGPPPEPIADSESGALAAPLAKKAPDRAAHFAHAHHAGPPAETLPADNKHPIVIDFSALADAVRADKEASKHASSRHRAADASARLSGLSPLARRPMMRPMLRSLERARTSSMPTPRDRGPDTANRDAQQQDFRLEPDALYVEIKQLARFAAMVSIAAAAGGDVEPRTYSREMPCLLVYDDDLEWCIVLSPPNPLPSGCPIQIRTRRMNVDTRLRKLREITPHFLLFQLDAQSPQLGTPSYPDIRQQNSGLTMAGHLYALSQ